MSLHGCQCKLRTYLVSLHGGCHVLLVLVWVEPHTKGATVSLQLWLWVRTYSTHQDSVTGYTRTVSQDTPGQCHRTHQDSVTGHTRTVSQDNGLKCFYLYNNYDHFWNHNKIFTHQNVRFNYSLSFMIVGIYLSVESLQREEFTVSLLTTQVYAACELKYYS